MERVAGSEGGGREAQEIEGGGEDWGRGQWNLGKNLTLKSKHFVTQEHP